jgi:DNA-binding transcriptional ArsR family regulator
LAQKAIRKLPPEVVDGLAPHQQRALDHPIRRQILRVLARHSSPQTQAEICAGIADTSVSTIGYHLLVLEECGFVSVSGVLTGPGDAERRFASNIADNRVVVAALQQTRELDELDD